MKRQREATAEAGQSRQTVRRCGTPLQVDELVPQTDLGAGVEGCDGFTVLHRGLVLADAAAVYDELGSFAADRLSWTALRDGGNVDSLCDTVKAYSGDYDCMMARGGRYRQQLLVRGRKAEALLDLPHLTRMRRAVLAAIVRLVATAAAEPAPHVTLLTEQLIRYLPTDRWFAPHYDKDRRDKSHAPLDPKAYDGPGDVLSTMCLGCACTLLMLPRPGYEAPGRHAFCVDLRPGDVYVLHDTARWEWLHGISVADDVEVARRAVVWRMLVD